MILFQFSLNKAESKVSMKIFIILINFIYFSYCLKGEIEKTENVTISIRFKSCKCFVDDPEYLKLGFCFIKAHSRTVTSINIGGAVLKDVPAPIRVIHFI